MPLPHETKALVHALAAAMLSLASAGLASLVVRTLFPTSADSLPEVIVSPALASQGRDFFAMSCSHCHGDDAHGDEGPDLHNLTISNARIANTIHNGIKGEMPTFAKKYDAPQIAALVSYLRTLK